MTNDLKVVNKKFEDIKIVVNWAGAAAIAITKLLISYGFKNIVLCDRDGILVSESDALNWMQKEVISVINPNHDTGLLNDAMKQAYIFVGVSAPNIVTKDMVA